jgi:aminoglycoside phosphotransferase
MQKILAEELPPQFHTHLGRIQRMMYPRNGNTADLTIIKADTGFFVAKRARGEQYCEWLDHERALLLALKLTTLPIPGLHEFLTFETSNGPESWILMDCLPGKPLSEVLALTTDHDKRELLLQNFGAMLHTIHITPVPTEVCLYNTPWLDRMLELATSNLARNFAEPAATPQLLARLHEQRPPAVAQTFIHGDYTLENVLILGTEVSGVIDWPCGAFGDPRYDVALATLPDEKEKVFQSEADRQAFFRGYGRNTLSVAAQTYFRDLYEFF